MRHDNKLTRPQNAVQNPISGDLSFENFTGKNALWPPSYRWQPLVVCILSPLLLNPESAPAWWVKRTGVHPQHSMCVVPFDISVLTDNISITVVNSFCSNSFHSPVKCHSHRHMMHYHACVFQKYIFASEKKSITTNNSLLLLTVHEFTLHTFFSVMQFSPIYIQWKGSSRSHLKSQCPNYC